MLEMFQDEAGWKQIVEFVGLRDKLYFYKMLHIVKDYKYVRCQRMLQKKSIAFEFYRECLFSRREQHRKMNVTRSHFHEIYTEEINKIVLSSDNDRIMTVIMANGIHNLAYGHANVKFF